MADELVGWTIFERPRDFPEGYVVKRWTSRPDGTVDDLVKQFASTLQQARAQVPPGLTCLPRFFDDDPAILEVWL